MWLTSVSIRRPVFILMVVAALIVMGLNSVGKMRLDLNPKVDFPYVSVVTTYPGAGPEEVETQVTKKIEDACASVNGVKNITSSSQEGVSLVSIELNIGVNNDLAASDVREKVSGIRSNLPDAVKDPVVQKVDFNSQPIIYYSLIGNRPSRDLRDMADNLIKQRLSKVGDVAAVNVSGGDVREIQVAVYKDRLDAYGVPIKQLVSLIQGNNLNFPVGHVIEGNREYSIRVVGEFPNVATIGETRLRMPNGQTVKLSDIAKVEDTIAERRDLTRVNRQGSIALVVQKTSEGNTVEVARGIKKEVAQLQKELPKDVKFVLTQDLSVNVENNVDDVKSSLFLGAFLAVLVVYAFLHSARGTFIVAIAIPTSIIATFLPMYAFGFTLNGMTMMALSLSVGILVDDSIVVLENVYRHLAKGEQPVEAAINGRSEIGLAAITITLVDVVVFVPIAFMGGVVGQFFKSFGITVACATLFSLFMSFTLTPMLASRWYKAGEGTEAHTGFFGAVNRFYSFLDHLYRRVLGWALTYRGIIVFAGTGLLILIFVTIIASFTKSYAMAPTLIVLFVVFGLMLMWRYRILGLFVLGGSIAAIFLAITIGAQAPKPLLLFRFAPDQDQGQVSIIGELPAGTALDTTNQVAVQVEDVVAKNSNVLDILTFVGHTASGFRSLASEGTQYFSMNVHLKDKVSLGDSINPFAKERRAKLRQVSDAVVAEQLRNAIGRIPGATIKVAAVTGFGGGSAPLQIDLQGQDINQLTALGGQVLKVFKEEPGALNADISTRIGKPEQRIEVDRDKAASFGLSVAQVAGALRTSLEGDDTVVYREGGNEYKIRVRFADIERHDINEVNDIVVGNVLGPGGVMQPVHLGDVATTTPSSGPTKIDRLNRQRLVSVTANVLPGYAPGNMQLNMKPKLDAINFAAAGATYAWGGENKTQAEEGVYMMAALGLAIVLVYMLMAALFDNLLYPFVIMLSLPQAMVGALLGLMVAGHALTIIAMIGIIMLVGLVTKNAILLVDYTNTLRERGLSRTDAILEAGPTRLRPILMTTIAMIFGMLPTALGLGRGAEFRAPLASPVIGGLILSTMLTLLVIPCVYTYFDDLSRFISRTIFRRRLESEGPTTAAPKEPAAVG